MLKLSPRTWVYIIAAVIFVVIGLSLSSCSYEHRLAKWCARCTLKETQKDSLGPETTKREPFDTLLWAKNRLGKDIVASNCDSLVKLLAANNGTIITKQDGVTTEVTGGQGKPLRFKCAADSLAFLLKLERQRTTQVQYKITEHEVPARCDLPHLSGWDTFFIKTGQAYWSILLIALLLFIGWRIVSGLGH